MVQKQVKQRWRRTWIACLKFEFNSKPEKLLSTSNLGEVIQKLSEFVREELKQFPKREQKIIFTKIKFEAVHYIRGRNPYVRVLREKKKA